MLVWVASLIADGEGVPQSLSSCVLLVLLWCCCGVGLLCVWGLLVLVDSWLLRCLRLCVLGLVWFAGSVRFVLCSVSSPVFWRGCLAQAAAVNGTFVQPFDLCEDV